VTTKNPAYGQQDRLHALSVDDETKAPKAVVLSDVDSGYSVMKATKHATEAEKFLNFLWGVDNQKALLRACERAICLHRRRCQLECHQRHGPPRL
jgi:hypothetical protein